MSIQHIHDAVRTGKLTAEQGAMLIELRRELRMRRSRLYRMWAWLRRWWA